MIIDIDGLPVVALGDPHLGRSFLNGTPLHRRGDREIMQWADFEASLNRIPDGVKVHVCMGDLFDRWAVPFHVIRKAADAYKRAADLNPDVEYVILAGNHDLSKEVEKVSAFGLFSDILENHPNITIVVGFTHVVEIEGKRLVFVPWSPMLNASEMVDEFQGDLECADAVFGHWDVVAVGDTSNLIPTETFRILGVKQAITGHDHTSRRLTMHDIPVTVTGSMQPYSFSEDVDQVFYMTFTLEEYEAILASGKEKLLENRCVRVILGPGESVSRVVDCLMFKTKQDGVEEDTVDVAVEIGDFSFDRLFEEVLVGEGVDPEFISLTRKKVEEERVRQ